MRTYIIGDGDWPALISARLGVPFCMLLRENGLYSGAWLLPGREIAVPEGLCGARGDFPCPAAAVRAPARGLIRLRCRYGDTFEALAAASGVSASALRALNAPLTFIPPGATIIAFAPRRKGCF